MAFESGDGANAVAVHTALVSAVIAIVVVAGALTFGANLSRVATQPRLHGWNWDVAVGNPHSADVAKTAIPSLSGNRGVASISSIASQEEGTARIDGLDTMIFGIDVVKGTELVPYTAGRAPRGANEIAFGAKTLHDRHLSIGERVRVSGGGPELEMLITGQVLLTPIVVNQSVPLGQAAVVSGAGLRALHIPAAKNVFLVRFDPAANRTATMRQLRADFPGTVLSATRPSDIENLRRVDRMPAVLAALFALIALLIVGNMLVSSVRRRRRELAVMRTMGFVRRQVRATVQWQASMVAFAAIIIGVPLGIVAGRAGWAIVDNQLGLPSDAIIPAARLLVLALVAFVAINLIAIVPAWISTRTPPAGILRTE
jgi:hypothetical protein